MFMCMYSCVQLDLDELRELFRFMYPDAKPDAQCTCVNMIRPFLDNSVVTEPNFFDVLCAVEAKAIEIGVPEWGQTTAASGEDGLQSPRNKLRPGGLRRRSFAGRSKPIEAVAARLPSLMKYCQGSASASGPVSPTPSQAEEVPNTTQKSSAKQGLRPNSEAGKEGVVTTL